jgi:hypothetical protein
MFYQWLKGSHQGSCEHASSYYLVAGMPISTGSRDHPSGPTLKATFPNHPHPRGYPNSDTNLEGPKGISNRNGGTSSSKEFAITVMKSIHQDINVGNKSSSRLMHQLPLPMKTYHQMRLLTKRMLNQVFMLKISCGNQRNLSYLFMPSQVFHPHRH